MTHTNRIRLLVLAAAMVTAPFITGCTVHAGYYDPYYGGYRGWAAQQPYYYRWERESHRRHEEFEHRNREEQREYWQWRHHQRD